MALIATACGAGASTASSSQQALRSGTMQVDGFTRTYRVYYPPSVTTSSRPVPLLLALHGGNQYGDAMEQTTGFDSLADADQFIVAYPNGHGQTWNAGGCCGYPNVSTDNEVHFIDALITRLESDGRVDRSRVYLTGFSAGAAMSYTVACRLTSRIAAVAVVAGTMKLGSCHPPMPVSVMEIHGTADQELPSTGGVIGQTRDVSPATADVVAAWASLDGCPGSPTTESSGAVQITRWTDCADGTTVVLQMVQGGDHNWYGPDLGGADASLDATQVIWQFLRGYKR